MPRNEFTANIALERAAIERAHFAVVLAPSGRPVRRVTRKPGMLARIAALFA